MSDHDDMAEFMAQLLEMGANKEQMYQAYQMIVACLVKAEGGTKVFDLNALTDLVAGHHLAAKLDTNTMTLTVQLSELPEDKNMPEPTVQGNQTKH